MIYLLANLDLIVGADKVVWFFVVTQYGVLAHVRRTLRKNLPFDRAILKVGGTLIISLSTYPLIPKKHEFVLSWG
jgi:threonine/homoserine/homoserine lactone efflux protein